MKRREITVFVQTLENFIVLVYLYFKEIQTLLFSCLSKALQKENTYGSTQLNLSAVGS